MIRSMTGFGAAAAEGRSGRFSVEIRAVNGKFYKSSIRLPEELLPLEAEIDQIASKRLGRGSVTVSIRFLPSPQAGLARINAEVVASYLEQLAAAVPPSLREACRIDAAAVLSLPGALAADAGDLLLEEARGIVAALVEEACTRVVEMRRREGAALAVQLRGLGEEIASRVAAIEARAPAVLVEYRSRLHARIDALLAESGTALREEDLLREVAIYADRSDVAEETTRLAGHLAQLDAALSPAEGGPAGRMLDFLAQEMLREANTIGSKSGDTEISRLTVEVKSFIERIKEQAANVE